MMNAVLLDDIAARVLDISAGGCLFEAGKRLPIGAVGTLDLEIEGQRHTEWFRVCRVEVKESLVSTWLIAAEFLPLAVPGDDSLRGVMGRMRPAAGVEAKPRMAGRSSGDPGKSPRTLTPRGPKTNGRSPHLARKVVKLERLDGSAGDGSAVAHTMETDAPGIRRRLKGEVHMKSLIVRLVRDDQGQDLIEYVLIGTFVSIAALVGATALGTNLNTWYQNVANWVQANSTV